jgi:hypothetical protein
MLALAGGSAGAFLPAILGRRDGRGRRRRPSLGGGLLGAGLGYASPYIWNWITGGESSEGAAGEEQSNTNTDGDDSLNVPEPSGDPLDEYDPLDRPFLAYNPPDRSLYDPLGKSGAWLEKIDNKEKQAGSGLYGLLGGGLAGGLGAGLAYLLREDESDDVYEQLKPEFKKRNPKKKATRKAVTEWADNLKPEERSKLMAKARAK